MLQEIRQAVRSLARRPGFTAVVLATFALGIGANTAIFSVVDGVLWQELPFRDAERLVTIWERDLFSGDTRLAVGPANFLDLRDQATTLSGLAAIDPSGVDMVREGVPETVPAQAVSEGFFDILGTPPLLGTTFAADDHEAGGAPSVVLSHGFWRDRYASDPRIVGRTIELDGEPHTVRGVMGDSFRLFEETSLWLPRITTERDRQSRLSRYLTLVGRLAPGATMDEAEAELAAIASRLAGDLPRTNADTRFQLIPLPEHLVGAARPGLLLLLGTAALVLLIACLNIANLLLVRGTERTREIAIRSTIGATRGRLARQILLETLLLAGAGGSIGVLLGVFGTDAVVALGPKTLPRAAEIGADVRMLAFGLGVTMLTAALVSIAPIARLRRPSDPLRRAGSRGTDTAGEKGFRDTVVALEIAFSFVLLIAASLLGRSFERVTSTDPGFRPDGALMVQMFIWDRYGSAAERIGFFREAMARLEGLPMVERVGGSTSVPFAEVKIDIDTAIEASGTGRDAEAGFVSAATEGYFEALGIPLLRGRVFDASDGAAPVAIVGETMAKRLFGDDDPIGKRIRLAYGRPVDREVIGVVGDVRHKSLLESGRADVYAPYAESGVGHLTLVVQTSGGGSALEHIPAIQKTIWEINPTVPIYTTHSMTERLRESLEHRRFVLSLVASFALLALVLAAVGIYGVLSFHTSRRTPEIGIRAALGAERRQIAMLVLGGALRLAAAGIVAGVAISLTVTRFLEGMLFGISRHDPITFFAGAVALGAIAIGACWIPLRRAVRVDPAIALRYE